MSSQLVLRWIRSVSVSRFCSQLPTHFQHRNAKHRFECRECGREFKTEEGMEKVGDGSWARLFLLMAFQHFDAVHQFKCHECDAKFDSQFRMDQVIRFLLPVPQCFISHVLQHYIAKHRFTCSVCPNWFTSENALKQV